MTLSALRLLFRNSYMRVNPRNGVKLDHLALTEIATVSFTISLLEAIELHVIYDYPLQLTGTAWEYYVFIKGIWNELVI